MMMDMSLNLRSMIEKYGGEDDKLINSYKTSVYNRRGVFSPTAGKAEQEMADNFKKTAHYLEAKYPTTSKIFYGLADTYRLEAEEARKDAEDGRF